MNDLILTKEMKEQLAGLMPMSNGSTYDYTPDVFLQTKDVMVTDAELNDKGEVITDAEYEEVYIIDEKLHPVFKIKQLTKEQTNTIKDKIAELSRKMSNKNNKLNMKYITEQENLFMDMLHSTLITWSNIRCTNTGVIIEYDGEMSTMLSMPDNILSEVFNEVMRITGFLPNGVV